MYGHNSLLSLISYGEGNLGYPQSVQKPAPKADKSYHISLKKQVPTHPQLFCYDKLVGWWEPTFEYPTNLYLRKKRGVCATDPPAFSGSPHYCTSSKNQPSEPRVVTIYRPGSEKLTTNRAISPSLVFSCPMRSIVVVIAESPL